MSFPLTAQAFLRDLAANNQREWFQANKKRYETELKRPAASFAEALNRALCDETGRTLAAKTYRINRDVRFSKDKTPYNEHLRIAFRPVASAGGGDMANPGFFLSLEPSELILGAGVFQFAGPVLDAHRQAIDDEQTGGALAAFCDARIAEGYRLNEADLKKVPGGFDKDHKRGAYLKRKGLALMRGQPLDPKMTEQAFDAHCLQAFQSLKPLFDWLMDNVIEPDMC